MKFITTLALLLTLQSCAEEDNSAADLYEQGNSYLEKSRDGEYHKKPEAQLALDSYLKAAEKGHIEAQYQYGFTKIKWMFAKEAPQESQKDDYILALKQLIKAANSGNAEAKKFYNFIRYEKDSAFYEQIPQEWYKAAEERAK